MATKKPDSVSRFQWRWDEGARISPAEMERGTSVVHDGVAYFNPAGSQNVFACDPNNEYAWSLLMQPCPQRRFGLAVVNHRLTAVGGESPSGPNCSNWEGTNCMSSFKDDMWDRARDQNGAYYPPMPTRRVYPAVVCYCEYLIAAGGAASWGGSCVDVVEILNTETCKWYTACSLPQPVTDMMAIALGTNLFVVGGFRGRGSSIHVPSKTVLKCHIHTLFDSTNPQQLQNTDTKVWEAVADIPAYNSSCVKMFGWLLAVGGSTDFGAGLYKPTNDVYMYDPDSDSWPVVGHMPTARHSSLVVAIKNSVVVVGGRTVALFIKPRKCNIVEVGFLLLSDEELHFAAFEEAVKEKGKLNQTIMQCMFVGPPGSGKSSLMKRLTGEYPSPPLHSTGVAERVIQVEIRKPMASTASGLVWNKLSFNREATSLMMGITRNQASDLSPPSERSEPDSSRFQPIVLSTSPADVGSTHSHVQPAVSSVRSPLRLFKSALRRKGWLNSKEYIQGASTVYLTDTGGQMEFQELLPALISGPSIFFLVFRLDRDLNERITMKYDHPVTGASTEPYTTKDILLQSLASIASMGTRADKGQQCRPLKPKAFFVGTHRDKVSETDIQRVDDHLRQLIRSTPHFDQGIVQFASKDCIVFAVNNLADGDSDVRLVQAAIERMSKHDDFKVSTPTSWLIFSLAIRQLEKRVLSYDDCEVVAKHCGIDSRDELDAALWFLHTKMGLIRHYQGEGLQTIVIQDTQVLFHNITGLIVQEEFKKRGVFSLSDFERISSNSSDLLLSAAKLVSLLKHLRIIAPIGKEGQDVKYFMPCVLAHSSSVLRETPQVQVPSASSIPPLLVWFRCGYCPKGLFPAVVVYLLSEKNCKWNLETGEVFRDQISFSLGPYCDAVRLKLFPTFCEISYDRNVKASDSKCTISHATLCNEVRQCIEKGIEEVTSDLNYMRHAEQRLAFYCSESHEGVQEPHPAKIIFHKQEPQNLCCVLTRRILDVPKGSSVWFCEPVPATAASTDPYGEHARSSGLHPNPPTKSVTAAVTRSGSEVAQLGTSQQVPPFQAVHTQTHAQLSISPRSVPPTEPEPDKPTLIKLLKFKCANEKEIDISVEVGTNYEKFGIFLLKDENGSRVKNMVHRHLRDPEPINRQILTEWVNGRGEPLTWATLVNVLRDIELCTLADDISTIKCPGLTTT